MLRTRAVPLTPRSQRSISATSPAETMSVLLTISTLAKAICSCEPVFPCVYSDSSRPSTSIARPSSRKLRWISWSIRNVRTIGPGSAGPVASIRMRSYCWRRRVTLTSARIRSRRTVPHTRPSSISKISSSVATIGAPSAVTSPTSFWMTRIRRPLSATMRLISVVFPAPMAPARTVTGILGVMKAHMI